MATLTADPPRVSVCIPTYRGASTLGAAIQSVLAQSFTDFELIVVDDGSPDDTAQVVACFRDPRVRYLRNDRNLGPEGNWNRCLEEAQGTYFKLLPHDDTLRADCLARQVAVLEADTGRRLVLVFSARQVVGPAGEVLMTRGCLGIREGEVDAFDLMRRCVRHGTNVIGEPGAVLLRRDLAERVGRFDASAPYLIDLDYWFRMLAHGRAAYVNAPLASFRVSASQWSVALGRQQSRDFHACVERHRTLVAPALHWQDRLIGSVTPFLNGLARQIFYRLYLR